MRTDIIINTHAKIMVGIARFELATSRPPDVHANRAELYPEIGCGCGCGCGCECGPACREVGVGLPAVR